MNRLANHLVHFFITSDTSSRSVASRPAVWGVEVGLMACGCHPLPSNLIIDVVSIFPRGLACTAPPASLSPRSFPASVPPRTRDAFANHVPLSEPLSIRLCQPISLIPFAQLGGQGRLGEAAAIQVKKRRSWFVLDLGVARQPPTRPRVPSPTRTQFHLCVPK